LRLQSRKEKFCAVSKMLLFHFYFRIPPAVRTCFYLQTPSLNFPSLYRSHIL
jgi:hypothetical protein